jgi:malonyl-CoA/methylmalonyl-CoA synthetase
MLMDQWDRVRTRTSIAVIDAKGEHSFASIDAHASRIAAHLAISQGERVALMCTAGASFVAALLGVLRAGGCVVVLSPLHPPPESSYFLADAEVRTILVTRDLADQARAFAGDRALVDVDAVPQADGPFAPGPDALQLYTSGTTGRPKGAVISQGALGAQMKILHEAWELSERDVLLHVLPLHHMHGLAIALLPMLTAGGCARMLARFDAAAVWDAMAHATVLMAVPTIYAKLLGAFDAADDGTRVRWTRHARALRLATSGSAALPTTFAERWRAIAGDIPLERFGMTEIGVGIANPLRGERKPGSVGLPILETRIVGEDGKDAETGELFVRGPTLFTGYFRKPEATADAFAGEWFRTGDTVTRDADGYFRVLGRTSVDILKSGGYKLSALEIEEVLRDHPNIAEVAVVGLPDETWGERVVACIVARGKAPSAQDVRAFAKKRLASYKVPKDVIVMAELPRNTVGKVIKPELVSRLRSL